MSVLNYAVDIRQFGDIGFVGRICEVLYSGQDGDEIFCTRIYRTAEDALYMARAWIEDNRER
jgi:hypothetical protein